MRRVLPDVLRPPTMISCAQVDRDFRDTAPCTSGDAGYDLGLFPRATAQPDGEQPVFEAQKLLIENRQSVGACIDPKPFPAALRVVYAPLGLPEELGAWWELKGWAEANLGRDASVGARIGVLQALHYWELRREAVF